MINWSLERDIWDRAFRRVLKVDPQDCSLLVTEPLFNLPSLMAREAPRLHSRRTAGGLRRRRCAELQRPAPCRRSRWFLTACCRCRRRSRETWMR